MLLLITPSMPADHLKMVIGFINQFNRRDSKRTGRVKIIETGNTPDDRANAWSLLREDSAIGKPALSAARPL